MIIALTASLFEEEREIVLSQGCDDFVHKPVSEDLIFEKMTQHLGILFVYGDSTKPISVKDNALASLQMSDLVVMPSQWLKQMQQAATIAKPAPLISLIAQIPPEHLALATPLRQVVDRYQFEPIIQLFENVKDYERESDRDSVRAAFREKARNFNCR